MTFKDQFRFIQQNMKKNKMRLFMTILATAIGCTFLIVLASVGFGLHKSIVKEMMEDQLVTAIDVHGKTDEDGNYLQINNQDIAYFESIEDVNAVTRRQDLQQTPLYSIDEYQTYSQTAVTHFPSEIKAGLKLSDGRLPEKDHEIVVGYHFQTSLAKQGAENEQIYDENGDLKDEYAFKGEILNHTFNMRIIKMDEGKEKEKFIPVEVVGIVAEPTREWMIDNSVFISDAIMQEIEKFTGSIGGYPELLEADRHANDAEERTYNQVKIYAGNVQDVTKISDQLKNDQYLTYSIVSEMKQVNMIFTIMKIGLLFVGTIALIIASIGIYNTMTMAVTERAPDIGIMKAVGANPKTIKNIFLLESSYIGFLGAFFGTVVAYGISYIVNFTLPFVVESIFEEPMPEGIVLSYIPISLTLISVAICLTVTIFSGWRPAQRATRVDVLKAMRREI